MGCYIFFRFVCVVWGRVGGEADFLIFYFSLSQIEEIQNDFIKKKERGKKKGIHLLLKPKGKKKIKCFGNWQD